MFLISWGMVVSPLVHQVVLGLLVHQVVLGLLVHQVVLGLLTQGVGMTILIAKIGVYSQQVDQLTRRCGVARFGGTPTRQEPPPPPCIATPWLRAHLKVQ